MTVTWNAADKTAGSTLSGGNLIVTSGGSAGGRATSSYSTGDISFKATFTNCLSNGGTGIGFISASFALTKISGNTGFIGDSKDGISFFDDGVVYYDYNTTSTPLATFTAPVPGDLVEVRLRILSSSTAGFYVRLNGGNWNNNPSANPATDTGAVSVTGLTGLPWFPAYEVDPSSGTITADFSALNGYTGTVAATLAITSAITAKHGVSGTASPTLAIVSAITAKHGVSGTASPALTVAMSAAGTFTPAGYSGTIGATLAVVSAIAAKHGVSGTTSQTLALTMSAAGTYTANSYTGTIGSVLTLTSAITAKHGVSGTMGPVLTVTPAFTGARGVSGILGSTLALTMSATGSVTPTVTGSAAITLTLSCAFTGRTGYIIAQPIRATTINAPSRTGSTIYATARGGSVIDAPSIQ